MATPDSAWSTVGSKSLGEGSMGGSSSMSMDEKDGVGGQGPWGGGSARFARPDASRQSSQPSIFRTNSGGADPVAGLGSGSYRPAGGTSTGTGWTTVTGRGRGTADSHRGRSGEEYGSGGVSDTQPTPLASDGVSLRQQPPLYSKAQLLSFFPFEREGSIPDALRNSDVADVIVCKHGPQVPVNHLPPSAEEAQAKLHGNGFLPSRPHQQARRQRQGTTPTRTRSAGQGTAPLRRNRSAGWDDGQGSPSSNFFGEDGLNDSLEDGLSSGPSSPSHAASLVGALEKEPSEGRHDYQARAAPTTSWRTADRSVPGLNAERSSSGGGGGGGGGGAGGGGGGGAGGVLGGLERSGSAAGQAGGRMGSGEERPGLGGALGPNQHKVLAAPTEQGSWRRKAGDAGSNVAASDRPQRTRSRNGSSEGSEEELDGDKGTEKQLEEDEENTCWYYKDPRGDIQGPFSAENMSSWYEQGYFDLRLLVCSAKEHTDPGSLQDADFIPLGTYFLTGKTAFLDHVPDVAAVAGSATSKSRTNSDTNTEGTEREKETATSSLSAAALSSASTSSSPSPALATSASTNAALSSSEGLQREGNGNRGEVGRGSGLNQNANGLGSEPLLPFARSSSGSSPFDSQYRGQNPMQQQPQQGAPQPFSTFIAPRWAMPHQYGARMDHQQQPQQQQPHQPFGNSVGGFRSAFQQPFEVQEQHHGSSPHPSTGQQQPTSFRSDFNPLATRLGQMSLSGGNLSGIHAPLLSSPLSSTPSTSAHQPPPQAQQQGQAPQQPQQHSPQSQHQNLMSPFGFGGGGPQHSHFQGAFGYPGVGGPSWLPNAQLNANGASGFPQMQPPQYKWQQTDQQQPFGVPNPQHMQYQQQFQQQMYKQQLHQQQGQQPTPIQQQKLSPPQSQSQPQQQQEQPPPRQQQQPPSSQQTQTQSPPQQQKQQQQQQQRPQPQQQQQQQQPRQQQQRQQLPQEKQHQQPEIQEQQQTSTNAQAGEPEPKPTSKSQPSQPSPRQQQEQQQAQQKANAAAAAPWLRKSPVPAAAPPTQRKPVSLLEIQREQAEREAIAAAENLERQQQEEAAAAAAAANASAIPWSSPVTAAADAAPAAEPLLFQPVPSDNTSSASGAPEQPAIASAKAAPTTVAAQPRQPPKEERQRPMANTRAAKAVAAAIPRPKKVKSLLEIQREQELEDAARAEQEANHAAAVEASLGNALMSSSAGAALGSWNAPRVAPVVDLSAIQQQQARELEAAQQASAAANAAVLNATLPSMGPVSAADLLKPAVSQSKPLLATPAQGAVRGPAANMVLLSGYPNMAKGGWGGPPASQNKMPGGWSGPPPQLSQNRNGPAANTRVPPMNGSPSQGWNTPGPARGNGNDQWGAGTPAAATANQPTRTSPQSQTAPAAEKRQRAPSGSKSSAPPATSPATKKAGSGNEFGGPTMSAEFTKWCQKELKKITGNSDTTLASYLMTLDSDRQIRETISQVLGDSKPVSDFAVAFLQNKSFETGKGVSQAGGGKKNKEAKAASSAANVTLAASSGLALGAGVQAGGTAGTSGTFGLLGGDKPSTATQSKSSRRRQKKKGKK